MKCHTNRHIATLTLLNRLLLTGVAALLPMITNAQSGDDGDGTEQQRWYQVELIVFARNQVPASQQEYWDSHIALAYPPNWVALKDPDTLILSDGENDLTNDANETFPGDLTANTSNLTTNSAGSETDVLDSASTNDDDPLSDTETSPAPTPPDLTREPFFLLPKTDLVLQDLHTDLNRKSNYRVLFHAAWRQPVLAEDEAKAILISGGKTFGEHQELEGSITLSVSRYLHLRSNLWLAEFLPNYGQDVKNWFELPKPPNKIPLTSADSSPLNFTLGEPRQESYLSLNNEYSKIIDQPYVIDKLYTLKQRRKMRSNELHYLDHPMLGIIVKVVPYELPAENQLEDANKTE